MAFWPDVTRGDKVKHHMLLENNIRQMVNALDGFGGGTARSPGCGVARIQVWNASGEALMAGCPVAFDADKGMVGGAVPAVRVCDAGKPFGVLQAALAPRAMGGCIVAGPAVVPIDGGSGEYAEPVLGGDGFAYSRSGTARVLCANGGTAVVLLGVTSVYDGYFAISTTLREVIDVVADPEASPPVEEQSHMGVFATISAGKALVNGTLYDVQAYEHATELGDTPTTFRLHYTMGSGVASVTIEAGDQASSTATEAYLEIGSASIASITQQQHGVAILLAVGSCEEAPAT